MDHLAVRGIDQLVMRLELVDSTPGIAGDLHQLINDPLLDRDIELVAGRRRIVPAGIGEDQLIAR